MSPADRRYPRAANDNRPVTADRYPIRTLPVVGRLNAETGEVVYTRAPPARLL